MSRRLSPLVAVTTIATILLLSACSPSGDSGEAEQHEPLDGGEIVIAANAQAPTLDPFMTTTNMTQDLANIMLEPLVALDSELKPQPVLASDWSTEDYSSFEFTLREGVVFHDGSEMTSADVLASLERWRSVASLGTTFFADAVFTAPDDLTVRIDLPDPLFLAPDVLSTAFVMSEESIAAATETGIAAEDIIGTGPYRFGEWVQDDHVSFTRFEDYSSPEGPSSGYAGEKLPMADTLTVRFITDPTTRLNGLRTGEYDLVYAVSPDSFEQVKSDPTLRYDATPNSYQGIVMNKAQGPTTDIELRRAINAALDQEAILQATYPDDLYALSGSFGQSGTSWYTDAGSESYNTADPELAEEYLALSDYAGEPLRFLTSSDFPQFYNAAVVTQQQLAEVGINVEIVDTDWATVVADRAKPEAWDLFATSFAASQPAQYYWAHPNFAGWTDSPEIAAAYEDLMTATSADAADAANDALHEAVFDYVPLTVHGATATVYAWAEDIDGFQLVFTPALYNLYRTQ